MPDWHAMLAQAASPPKRFMNAGSFCLKSKTCGNNALIFFWKAVIQRAVNGVLCDPARGAQQFPRRFLTVAYISL